MNSAANPETLADIAREIRYYFQAQKRSGNPEHRPWHQVLSDWADRIEAAWEREVKEWNALRVKVADFENTKERLAKTQAALERANRYGMQADEENGKLRDLVRRMLPGVEENFASAKELGEAIKGLSALKGVDSSEVDEVLEYWTALLHEARAAVNGEG